MMSENLSIVVNGLTFENPFILASAPPTASGAVIRKAFDLGWAGAVIKTIRDDDVVNSNVSPRFHALKQKNTVIGLENIEMLSDQSVGYWLKEIADIKRAYPGKVLIASIMGAEGIESWQKIAQRVIDAGADALELNFSCPNGVTAQGLGLAIGQNNQVIEEITKSVKEVSSVPVIVKLTPNVTSILMAAESAVKAGADAICAINTVIGFSGIDVETLMPKPNIAGYSTFGGFSGRGIKPIGLRCVAEIAKEVKVPIYASGGVSDWKDAVEYISLGASVVQICTEVMLSGLSIIQHLKSGLSEYLERKGYDSVAALRGLALNRLVSHQALSRTYKVCAYVDSTKCRTCKNCILICSESANGALFFEEEKVLVNQEICFGCSLCSIVCPRQAISMVSK
jgi:dihydropyrimidine dehydrogenase (NAD+) subunit PreA